MNRFAGRALISVFLISLMLGALLAGCGGGGTGAQAGVGSGGTGSYTSGPVSGLGSIIVYGIRYDDSGATITDVDGNVHPRSDVKLGMTVMVRGTAVSNALATAQTVQFGSELLGPVASSTPDGSGGGTLVVLGQTVKVTAKTLYGDGVTGFSALTVGEVVEVYGLPDGQGTITATRIERKTSGVATYRLRGVIKGIPTATRLLIGAATIVYGSADVRTPVTDGALINVRLQLAQSGSEWVATRIQSGAGHVPDLAQAQVEGVISKLVDATHFVVNGLTVEASAAVQSAAAGVLAVGTRVSVQGAVRLGVLVASSVNVEADEGSEDIELHGTISSLNVSASTFIVRGTAVSYASVTPGGGALAEGVCVEVKGEQFIGSQLQATELEVHDASDCH